MRRPSCTTRCVVAARLAVGVLPVLGLLLLGAILTHMGQFGFLYLPQKVALDWQRINPLQNYGRIFSLTNVVHLGFGLLKVLLIVAVAGWCLWGERGRLMNLSGQSSAEIGAYLLQRAALDQPQDRRRARRARPVRLRLSVLEARAGPADDDAGAEGRSQDAARRSADRRPPQADPAADGPPPPEHDRSQGRRDRHQPHRAGHRPAIRRRKNGRPDRHRQRGRRPGPAHPPPRPWKTASRSSSARSWPAPSMPTSKSASKSPPSNTPPSPKSSATSISSRKSRCRDKGA